MLQSGQMRSITSAIFKDMKINFDGFMPFLAELATEKLIKNQLMQKTETVVELYLLDGFDFSSRDSGSESDPYLVVSCGNFHLNDRSNYQIDQACPEFYKRLQFPAVFPGAQPVVIEAYDYDDLFGDDLIGKTTIDLDDRFFSPNWQAVEEKPIEHRQLHHPCTNLSQGVICLWLDV
jgi:Ca2+-dependent lipid-binding protein